MMIDMKKKLSLGIMILSLCCITGCEKMEHGPASNLPEEATKVWLTQVHAEVESAVKDVEKVTSDAAQIMEEADSAVEEIKKLIEELEAQTGKEAVWEQGEEQLESEGNTQDNSQGEQLEQSYEFTHSEKEYFDDALFIGDSRTKGLQLFGTLDNADFFAEPGLSLYNLSKTKLEVGEFGKLKLEELLEQVQYGKIYLMLGINELGYHFDTTQEKYQELVTKLRQMQPDAILYVCANLHVTEVRDKYDEIHNNTNIDKMNAYIATMADEQDIFYLDINELFDDEEGNLDKEIASDDSHVLGAAYEDWCKWLGENTIVK